MPSRATSCSITGATPWVSTSRSISVVRSLKGIAATPPSAHLRVEIFHFVEIFPDLVELREDALLEEHGELLGRVVDGLALLAIEALVPGIDLDLPDAQDRADGRILPLDLLAQRLEALGRDVDPDIADVVVALEVLLDRLDRARAEIEHAVRVLAQVQVAHAHDVVFPQTFAVEQEVLHGRPVLVEALPVERDRQQHLADAGDVVHQLVGLDVELLGQAHDVALDDLAARALEHLAHS